MNPTKIYNRANHKQRRRELRKNLTDPEQILWNKLRNKQLGVKFRRQQGVGIYIVDFYSAECALVIELDGDSHYSSGALQYDARRDSYLKQLQLKILRFTNLDVQDNIEGVLTAILESINGANG